MNFNFNLKMLLLISNLLLITQATQSSEQLPQNILGSQIADSNLQTVDSGLKQAQETKNRILSELITDGDTFNKYVSEAKYQVLQLLNNFLPEQFNKLNESFVKLLSKVNNNNTDFYINIKENDSILYNILGYLQPGKVKLTDFLLNVKYHLQDFIIKCNDIIKNINNNNGSRTQNIKDILNNISQYYKVCSKLFPTVQNNLDGNYNIYKLSLMIRTSIINEQDNGEDNNKKTIDKLLSIITPNYLDDDKECKNTIIKLLSNNGDIKDKIEKLFTNIKAKSEYRGIFQEVNHFLRTINETLYKYKKGTEKSINIDCINKFQTLIQKTINNYKCVTYMNNVLLRICNDNNNSLDKYNSFVENYNTNISNSISNDELDELIIMFKGDIMDTIPYIDKILTRLIYIITEENNKNLYKQEEIKDLNNKLISNEILAGFLCNINYFVPKTLSNLPLFDYNTLNISDIKKQNQLLGNIIDKIKDKYTMVINKIEKTEENFYKKYTSFYNDHKYISEYSSFDKTMEQYKDVTQVIHNFIENYLTIFKNYKALVTNIKNKAEELIEINQGLQNFLLFPDSVSSNNNVSSIDESSSNGYNTKDSGSAYSSYQANQGEMQQYITYMTELNISKSKLESEYDSEDDSKAKYEKMRENDPYIQYIDSYTPSGFETLKEEDKNVLNEINDLVFDLLHNDKLKDTIIKEFQSKSTNTSIRKIVINKLLLEISMKDSKYLENSKYLKDGKYFGNSKYLQFIKDIITNNIYKLASSYYIHQYQQLQQGEDTIKNLCNKIKNKKRKKYINYVLHRIQDPSYSDNEVLRNTIPNACSSDSTTNEAQERNVLATKSATHIFNFPNPDEKTIYLQDIETNYYYFIINLHQVFKEMIELKVIDYNGDDLDYYYNSIKSIGEHFTETFIGKFCEAIDNHYITNPKIIDFIMDLKAQQDKDKYFYRKYLYKNLPESYEKRLEDDKECCEPPEKDSSWIYGIK